MFNEYLHTVVETLEKICVTQSKAMERAAELLAGTLDRDGLIYLFGCGHSHMLAEEGFYRAGGLGAVCAVLPAEFMLHEGAVKSSTLERMECLAREVLNRYPMTERDSLVVFSTSGVNGMPVETARLARAGGVKVVGVSSGAYREDAPRHSLGLRLGDVCDVHIDNLTPHGDAGYTLKGVEARMGPISMLCGAYILNCLLARAAELAHGGGATPAVYRSGNVEGGREANQAVIKRYRSRIRAL